jgi:hypothetical protein
MNNFTPEVRLVGKDSDLIAIQCIPKNVDCRFVAIGEISEETGRKVHRVIIGIWHKDPPHAMVAGSLLSQTEGREGAQRFLLGAGIFSPNSVMDGYFDSDSCRNSKQIGYDRPGSEKYPFKEGELKAFLGDESIEPNQDVSRVSEVLLAHVLKSIETTVTALREL